MKVIRTTAVALFAGSALVLGGVAVAKGSNGEGCVERQSSMQGEGHGRHAQGEKHEHGRHAKGERHQHGSHAQGEAGRGHGHGNHQRMGRMGGNHQHMAAMHARMAAMHAAPAAEEAPAATEPQKQ